MTGTRIEIRDVLALRIDAAGRIGRLRVIGVADQPRQWISVKICVADLGAGSSWQDQHASATAKIVAPERTFAGVDKPDLAPDPNKPQGQPRRGYVFVAEIDVLASPAVPPLVIGRQPVPVNVCASYMLGDKSKAIRSFDAITPTAEFDVGVLFVHGIGKQRRAETLAQWSAPLLRWINAWLGGATDAVAAKLPPNHLEDWLNALVSRGPLTEVDPDYADRAAYAKKLVRTAHAPTYSQWQAEQAAMRRAQPPRTPPAMTAHELDDAYAVMRSITEDIRASAVGGSADFRSAYVRDVGAHSAEPSSVEVHVEAMTADGYLLRSRWMLAESHWAETFWAPSFYGFGRWCLLAAPVLLVHYIAMARLRQPAWLRWMLGALCLSLVVTLAQLVFVLLSILWLVPWDRLRAGVLRVQLLLAGVVGDSYVLLDDPVQRRAILDRVHRDLEWLIQRCRSVVLIAPSQGAAVGELVLSQRTQPVAGKVTAFATLGAGVQTLSAIEELSENGAAKIAGWAAIISTLALAVTATIALMRSWPMAPTIAAGVALVGVVLAAQRAWVVHPGRPPILPRAAWLRPWFDFFARKDVVPYGPFVDAKNNSDTYKPKEVRNRDSYVGDHTGYWQNLEQVVGPLARLIGDAAGFKPLATLLPDDEATLARLERARLSRLGFLGVARLVTLVATAILLHVHWHDWFAIGIWAIGWIQSKLGFEMGTLRAPALDVWLHALVVLLPPLVHKTLVNATFDGWTTGEVERLLRRSAGSPATHWAATFTVMLVIVLAATIQYVWPSPPAIAFGVTALAALLLAWAARHVHRVKVETDPKAA